MSSMYLQFKLTGTELQQGTYNWVINNINTIECHCLQYYVSTRISSSLQETVNMLVNMQVNDHMQLQSSCGETDTFPLRVIHSSTRIKCVH